MAIFPGSRPSEIRRNFPIQIEAAVELCKQAPVMKLAISVSSKELIHWMHLTLEAQAKKHGFMPNVTFVPFEQRYELMQNAYLALAKSGTVTLELALHGVPTVVTYALSSLNYYIAKYLLRLSIPYFCIVNIIKKKEVFPELIKMQVTAKTISEKLFSLHIDKERCAQIALDCKEISALLQSDVLPTHKAAQAIQELVYAKN